MAGLASQDKWSDPPDLEEGLGRRKYEPLTWAEFINSTTFHGVRFIFEKTHRIRRYNYRRESCVQIRRETKWRKL